jgi:hypothetical protein
MIICTTPTDSLLVELLLEFMTVRAERIVAPAGAAVFVPELAECQALFSDLDLCPPALMEPKGLCQGC